MSDPGDEMFDHADYPPNFGERAEEHYRAAMAMSEKHRKNWVEACQERERLRTALKSYVAHSEEWERCQKLSREAQERLDQAREALS